MTKSLLAQILIGLLVAACAAPAASPSTSASPTQPPTATTAASVAPTAKPAPTRYEASVLMSDAHDVDALAVGDNQLFLAVNIRGARPGDTRSSIAEMPLTGAGPLGSLTGPATLGGTEATGMEVGGIAVFKNEPYFSREFGPNPRDSGIFRYTGNQAIAVAGGPASPATLSLAGDGGPATLASLDRPVGVGFNAAGDLFIAESGAGRVRRVSAGVITTYAGRGPCGDSANPSPGPATQVALCLPGLLAMSASGDLFVTWRGLAWIAKVDRAGQLSVFANNFHASGLAIDTNGALLATDGANGRVVRFDASGTPTTIADGLGGTLAPAVGVDGSIYVLSSMTSPSGTTLMRIMKLRPA